MKTFSLRIGVIFLGIFSYTWALDNAVLDEMEEDSQASRRDIFTTPLVLSRNYGVFKIGYAYQYQDLSRVKNSSGVEVFPKVQSDQAAYFGIERGWIGGAGKRFMIGGYLDSALGEVFYVSLGAKFSVLLFKGWMVPYVGLGYQFENLKLQGDPFRYHVHAGVATLGSHFNISRGFGLDIQVRSGTPFYGLRNFANNYPASFINHVSVMVSFSIYDFSI